jgi:hypothetical protein
MSKLPLKYLKSNALRKGLLGGNPAWVVVGVIVWTPRLMRRLFGRTEEVVSTEKLRPGQFVRVEALPTPTRSQRKAALKAERRASRSSK